jgi:hypothetical protein
MDFFDSTYGNVVANKPCKANQHKVAADPHQSANAVQKFTHLRRSLRTSGMFLGNSQINSK